MTKSKVRMGGKTIETEKEMRERHPTDFYPTDPKLVSMIMKHIVNWEVDLCPSPRILDVGAGQGVWGDVAREYHPTALITGVEFTAEPQPQSYGTWVNSTRFQDYDPGDNMYDLIMGNPPFSQAEELIVKSFAMLHDPDPTIKPGGYDTMLVFLLRTAFLESIKRARGLWKQYPPSEVWNLAKRPSFLGGASSNTDDQAYSIFVWRGVELVRFPRINTRNWYRGFFFDWTKLWNEQYGTQGEMIFESDEE